ncbi:DUF6060 domain-containing protein [Salirhabdus sp. Marseille-P4669]|uniref:DUF6060 domain-containing protein n=1 Tax=Salirhabdus sp. Marseille-P4669 TaxID=2042310 RepID=UPI000C7E4938|nr:hypothetical protein [Salirhabdus sp. Marseille-P4669]
MLKFKSILIAAVLVLTFTSTVSASDTNDIKTMSVTPDEKYPNGYYDPELGGTIGAVYRTDEDGKLYQVPLSQWVEEQKIEQANTFKEEMFKKSLIYQSPKTTQPQSDIGIMAYIYDQYDESGNYQKNGSAVRVSDDLICNAVKCNVYVEMSRTIRSAFSTNLNSTYERNTVSAGVSFSYTKEAENSLKNGYNWEIKRGETAYVAFRPHLRRSYGYLYHYIEDGGSKWESSPREYSSVEYPIEKYNGTAEGEFYLVYR